MPKEYTGYQNVLQACENHNARLVAVSKTRSLDEMMGLYDLGQRVFAENRAQELIQKAEAMPKGIEWHLIGHLQRNKVSAVVPYAVCIQSLDSEKLWIKINEEAKIADRIVNCLLQIKVAREESKFGWSFEALIELLSSGKHREWKNVRITGVMGMTTLTDDKAMIRDEMKRLKFYFQKLKNDFFIGNEFKVLSMGMSGDYEIALEEGSNMVRIGTKLFE